MTNFFNLNFNIRQHKPIKYILMSAALTEYNPYFFPPQFLSLFHLFFSSRILFLNFASDLIFYKKEKIFDQFSDMGVARARTEILFNDQKKTFCYPKRQNPPLRWNLSLVLPLISSLFRQFAQISNPESVASSSSANKINE